MSLVDMPDRRIDSERTQHSGPADAEHGLLSEACLAASHVEDVGNRAISGIVLWEVRVEQDEGNPPDVDPPCADRDVPAIEGDRYAKRAPAVRIEHFANGTSSHLEPLIRVLLPAVGVDGLAKEAPPIEEADGDERHAEIRRRLHMVACEDTEASRVEGEFLVDAVLGAEVSNRAVEVTCVVRVEPRLFA